MMPAFAVSGDHPRVGGEKAFFSGKFDETKGSPPRGRGKVVAGEVEPLDAGITPAWAGKSAPLSVWLYLVGDHPRVGGEKNATAHQLLDKLGSPPRGRGKGYAQPDGQHDAGITPAWAGKSEYLFRELRNR